MFKFLTNTGSISKHASTFSLNSSSVSQEQSDTYSTGLPSSVLSSFSPQFVPGNLPVRGRTMKEYDEQLSTMKKENFNLKLRIFFLEERLGNIAKTDDHNDIMKKNVELRVELGSLQKEFVEQRNLLAKAYDAMESLDSDKEQQIHNLQLEFEQERTRLLEEIDNLRKEIEEQPMQPFDSLDLSVPVPISMDYAEKAHRDVACYQATEELKTLQQKICDLEDVADHLRCEIKWKDLTLNELESNNKACNANIDKLKKECKDKQEQLEHVQSVVEMKQEEVSEMTCNMEQAIIAAEELAEKLKSQEQRNRQLKKEIELHNVSKPSLNMNSDAHNNTLDDESVMYNQNQLLIELQSTHKQKLLQIEDLKQSVSNAITELTKSHAKVSQLELVIQGKETELVEIRSVFLERETTAINLQSQLSEMETELIAKDDELARSIADHENQIDALQKLLDEHKQDTLTIEARLKEEISEKQVSLTNQETKLQRAFLTVRGLLRQIEDAENTVKCLETEIKRKDEKICDLKSVIEESNAQGDKLGANTLDDADAISKEEQELIWAELSEKTRRLEVMTRERDQAIKEKETRSKDLENDIIQFQQNLATLNLGMTKLVEEANAKEQSYNDALQEEVLKLNKTEEKLQEQTKYVEELKSQILMLQDDIRTQKDYTSTLKVDFTKTEQQLVASQKSVCDILQQKKSELQTITETLVEKESRLTEMENEFETRGLLNEQLHKHIENLSDEIDMLKEMSSMMKKRLNEIQKETVPKDVHEEQQRVLHEKNIQLKDATSAMENMKMKLTDIDDLLQSQTCATEESNIKLYECQEEIAKLKENNQLLTSQISQIMADEIISNNKLYKLLEEKDHHLKDAISSLQNKEVMLQETQSQLLSHTSLVKDSNIRINELESQISILKEEVSKCTLEIKEKISLEMQQELQEKTDQVKVLYEKELFDKSCEIDCLKNEIHMVNEESETYRLESEESYSLIRLQMISLQRELDRGRDDRKEMEMNIARLQEMLRSTSECQGVKGRTLQRDLDNAIAARMLMERDLNDLKHRLNHKLPEELFKSIHRHQDALKKYKNYAWGVKHKLSKSVQCCDMLRTRLEELVVFMEEMLQLEKSGKLDLSCLTTKKKTALENSVVEWKQLSISTLDPSSFQKLLPSIKGMASPDGDNRSTYSFSTANDSFNCPPDDIIHSTMIDEIQDDHTKHTEASIVQDTPEQRPCQPRKFGSNIVRQNPNEKSYESEPWSEPDREVSRKRIGLDITSTKDLEATVKTTDSDAIVEKSSPRRGYRTETRRLQNKLRGLETMNKSLQCELSLFRSSNDGGDTVDVLPHELLMKLQEQREQLQASLDYNDKLRDVLQLTIQRVQGQGKFSVDLSRELHVNSELLAERDVKLNTLTAQLLLVEQELQETNIELTSTVTKLRSAEEELREANNRLEEHSDMQTKLLNTLDSVKILKTKLNDHDATCDTHRSAIKEKDESITRLEEEIQMLTRKTKIDYEKVDTLESELCEMKGEKKSLELQVVELSNSKNDLENALIISQGQVKAMKEAESRLHELTQSKYNVQEDLNLCRIKLDQIGLLQSTQNEELKEKIQQYKTVKEENEELRRVSETLESKVKRYQAYVTRTNKPDIASLHRQHSEMSDYVSDDAEMNHVISSPDLGIESDPGRDCNHDVELKHLRLINDSLERKLTRSKHALELTLGKLHDSNIKKEHAERTLCEQLHITHGVLKQARKNLAAHKETNSS